MGLAATNGDEKVRVFLEVPDGSSEAERSLDMREVAGSIPARPTNVI